MRKPILSRRVQNMQKIGLLANKRKCLLKIAPTKAEIIVKGILEKYNIPFHFQRIVYTPRMFYILDFTIQTKPRTIIEVDGGLHKDRATYDKRRERDILHTRAYKKYAFLRITNQQVFNGDVHDIIRRRFPKFYLSYPHD